MPQYNLRGIPVNFPYEAYPCQLEYMGRVIEALQEGKNALLESPTGTGKTLCLLCATLAWRESLKHQVLGQVGEVQSSPHSSQVVQGLREAYAELNAERVGHGNGGLPVIVYSSRTHSQLQQVMRELKATDYRPSNALLSSRQQTCLNPAVSSLNTAAANSACRKLVRGRACKWHLNVERHLKHNPDTVQQVLDIEEIVKFGQARVVCPYYLGREMAQSAEILFMPYNYLTDPSFRLGLGINWERAVIIFDEAHNVEGVCSDSASFDLPAPVLAGCIVEAGTAAELALTRAEGPDNVYNEFGKKEGGMAGFSQLATQLRQLQMVLQRLEALVAGLSVDPQKGLTRPGAFIFELFSQISLTTETYLVMDHVIDEALELLTSSAVDAGRSSGSRSSSYRLHSLQTALRLAFNSAQSVVEGPAGAPPPPPAHLGYRVHVHLQKAKDGRMLPTLSYWCFNPGLTMAQLALMKVGSIILTSGTLSPLTSFAQELSLPFPVRLENPHVIDPSQVWVGVVPVGPSGHALNSSYQTRDSKTYKEDLGNAIVNFARIVPDGLLVFFPSYGQLTACLDAWKAVNMAGNCIWERISKHKACVVEPRDSALFPQAAEDFKRKLQDPGYRGAVFFAVCRGKVSEGLDFSDRAGRAVVITGIPYATKTDPKVCIKQDLLNEQLRSRHKRPLDGEGFEPGLSGQQWYSQQAMRAVNQAMGRVIRHRRDYGAIILCDERFKAENIRRQLSKWLRDSVVLHPNYGSAASSLTQFFKKQAENARLGLVSDGGQAGVKGGLSGPNWGGGEGVGAFSNAVDREGRRGVPAMPAAPLAMDAVGITDLLGSVASLPPPPPSGSSQEGLSQGAVCAAGGSRLLGALGGGRGLQPPAAAPGCTQHAQQGRSRARPGSDVDELLAALGDDAQQGPGGQRASRGGARPFQAKPWERAGLPPSALQRQPSASRPALPVRPDAPTSTPLPSAVGPAHLILKHQQQQQHLQQQYEQQQQQQPHAGKRSVSPELAQQAPQRAQHQVLANGQPSSSDLAGSAASAAAPLGAATDPPLAPGVGRADRTASLAARTAATPPASDGAAVGGIEGGPGGGGEGGGRVRTSTSVRPSTSSAAAAAPASAPAAPPASAPPAAAAPAAAPASAPPAAAAPAAPPSQQAQVRAYLQELKGCLPGEAYRRVVAALQQYKRDGDREALVGEVVEVLKLPGRCHLLPGLARFLPRASQGTFLERVRSLVGDAAAAEKLPPLPSTTQAPAAAVTAHHASPQLDTTKAAAAGAAGGGDGRGIAHAHPSSGHHSSHVRPQQQRGQQVQQGLPGGSGPFHPSGTSSHPLQRSGQFGGGDDLRGMTAQQERQQCIRLKGAPAPGAGRHEGRRGGMQQLAGLLQRGREGRSPALVRDMWGKQARHGPSVVAVPASKGAALPPAPIRPSLGGARTAATLPPLGTKPIAAMAKCLACGKAPMDAPHQSACGHAACYACWLKAIALMKCPGCKRHVRKSQLTKMYFQ